MPQTHYTLGEALGRAAGGAFDNGAYEQGMGVGIKNAKTLAEARMAQRQSDLQSPENILSSVLGSAGINESDAPKFNNFAKYGTADAPEAPAVPRADFSDANSLLSGVLKTAAPQNDNFSAAPKQIKFPTQLSPELKQKFELAMRHKSSLEQALALGDKDLLHAVEASLTNARASGAGNDNTTQAQLLLHGKPQFEGQANGVTDVITGNQTLNGYGDSQIRQNDAQVVRNYADAAKKEQSIVGGGEKPMPVAAMRIQDENLDAISTAQGINADLSAFANQLDSGALNLGALANAMSGMKNFTGMSDEQSRNYESFKATLEKLRNDSLRLNKGVQTDGDAQRAWNELLTNLNDPNVVKQRLKEIDSLNGRAVKIRMAKNDNLRRNYGNEPMDYSPYTDITPAISAGGQQPAQPAAPQGGVKFLGFE